MNSPDPVRSTTPDLIVPSGFNRRTLMRTAAWSVPAISLASAAPAFASSRCQTISAHHVDWTLTSGAINNPDNDRSTGWLVRGTHTAKFISTAQQQYFDGTHETNGRDSNEPDGSFISFANNAANSTTAAVLTVTYAFEVTGNIDVSVNGILKLGYGNSSTAPQRTDRQVVQVQLVDGSVNQELARIAHQRRTGTNQGNFVYLPTGATSASYNALSRSDATVSANNTNGRFVLHQAQPGGGHQATATYTTPTPIRLTGSAQAPRTVSLVHTLTLDPLGTSSTTGRLVNDDVIINPPTVTVCPA